MTTIIRRTLKAVWYTAAGAVVLAALVLTALRLLLPMSAAYTPQIVAAVSDALGQPIRVAAFEPQWHGLGPVFVFKNMEVLDRDGGKPILHFAEARIGIDVFDSLLHWRLSDSHVTVRGIAITLVRGADGRISVAGFGSMATEGDRGRDNLALAERWLQAQQRIRIGGSDLYWRDAAGGGAPLHFAALDVELRNAGGRHVVSASMVLPHEYGQRLQVVAAFHGSLLDVTGWNGDVYLKGSGANLAPLAGDRRLAGIGVDGGAADVRAWGRVEGGRLRQLEGDVQVQGLRLTGGDKGASVQLTGLGARFRWYAFDGGWILDGDDFWLAAGGDVTPPTQFRIFTQRVGAGRETETQIGYLRVQDALPLLQLSDRLPARLHEALQAARPRGELHQAYVHLVTGGDKPAAPYFYTHFAHLGTGAPWRGVPAVAGLAGVIQGTPAAGHVELDGRAVTVADDRVFRAPLPAQRLQGRLTWRHNALGAWRVSSPGVTVSNPDITAGARFTMAGAPGRRPFVDLVADFDNGAIAHASRYLPAGKMHPKLVKWLDRALVNGRVTAGGLLVHGDLADFPFDHQRGNFEVRFNVENGILDYHDAWPRVEDMQAQIVIHGRSLEVDADQGHMLDSTIAPATARIDDLTAKPAILTVTGAAAGPVRDAMRIATETPLEAKIGRHLKGLQATGQCTLRLAMTLPLMHPATRIDGTLVFDGGTLSFPGKITLSQVAGPLHFSHEGIEADDIKAQILGYPAVIGAGTLKTAHTRITYFDARGRTDVAHLEGLKFIDLPFLNSLTGVTPWRAKLQLTESLADGHVRPALIVDSTLEGMRVDLPAPLAKAPADKTSLTVRIDDLGRPSPPVSFRYGGRLSGALRMDRAGGLERAELRFGDGDAVLPADGGIRITGSTARLSTGAWRDYMARRGGDTSTPGGPHAGGGILSRLNHVDVHVDKLEALDHWFDHVDLRATRGVDGWKLHVVSDELAGDIAVPADAGTAPAVLDLDYLKLRAGALGATSKKLDPADLHAVRLHSKQFSYQGADFGELHLTTSRIPGGVHLDQLRLDSKVMHASVTGDWRDDGAGQVSAFTANIDSRDIGKTLARFGYIGTIKSGKGTAALSATWRGGPLDVDLKTMNGSIALDLHGGRLLDVDPGAGRILGILSLQTLPRRLMLDFSDLFGKGFSFDSIRGDFAVQHGDAYTDDLVMEGPAAKVKVAGRVGLASRDYDQNVAVMPHLIGGLPLVGVLASGLPAGVAILVLQKLFENQIDDIMRVDYTVTGPWKNPNVERVNKVVKPPSAAG